MFNKFSTHMRTTAIISLVLVFALSTTWATTNRYSDSIVMKQGKKSKHGTLTLVSAEVEAEIRKWSLDSYLNEQGLNKVKITCEMTEELINSNGDTYYQLTFDFGPSDVYFDVPLELTIQGKYVEINSEASIKITKNALAVYLDEQGEDSVVITVELYYGWDGTLLFVFGPSGAHFEPELELIIKGGYIEDDMILIGEDGEALEYKVDKKQTKIAFFIFHFSRYSYDHYDY